MGRESELNRILEKVELDKFILIKEKLTCVWNE
jgi:hypothetical protein